jgi:hypothetical protein
MSFIFCTTSFPWSMYSCQYTYNWTQIRTFFCTPLRLSVFSDHRFMSRNSLQTHYRFLCYHWMSWWCVWIPTPSRSPSAIIIWIYAKSFQTGIDSDISLALSPFRITQSLCWPFSVYLLVDVRWFGWRKLLRNLLMAVLDVLLRWSFVQEWSLFHSSF